MEPMDEAAICPVDAPAVANDGAADTPPDIIATAAWGKELKSGVTTLSPTNLTASLAFSSAAFSFSNQSLWEAYAVSNVSRIKFSPLFIISSGMSQSNAFHTLFEKLDIPAAASNLNALRLSPSVGFGSMASGFDISPASPNAFIYRRRSSCKRLFSLSNSLIWFCIGFRSDNRELSVFMPLVAGLVQLCPELRQLLFVCGNRSIQFPNRAVPPIGRRIPYSRGKTPQSAGVISQLGGQRIISISESVLVAVQPSPDRCLLKPVLMQLVIRGRGTLPPVIGAGIRQILVRLALQLA